nr:MAG: capsid protein [Phoenicopteridae parvo-like hybrid virus]
MGRYGKETRKGKRDFSLPKYNYLGPGNSLYKGKPTNKNDEVAFHHDVRYGEYMKRKKNPYINWNQADEDAMTKFTDDDYGGFLGRRFFGFKRSAYNAGLIGGIDTQRSKRLRGSSIEPAVKEMAQAKDSSFNNLQTQTNMSDGDGSGQGGNLKETPIDPTPSYLATGPEDYTFSKLPFTQIRNYRASALYSFDMIYRMTSPYDPAVSNTTGSIPGAGGTIAVASSGPDPDLNVLPKANWFDFYAGMYNYYHVVKCDWTLYLENTGGEPLYVHQMYYNDEAPPTGATNTDVMSWEGVRTRILQAPYKAIDATLGGVLTNESITTSSTTNMVDEDDVGTQTAINYTAGNNVASRNGTTTMQMSGSYRPGQFRREVNLDNLVENWTLVNTNPSLPERLMFRLMPENPAINSTSARGDQISFKSFFKCEYIVEFKELKAGLRWPVQRQPITVTIVQDITTPTL